MTVERRIVVSLGDIRAVILECKECHAQKTIPPNKIPVGGTFLEKCDICGTKWWSSGSVEKPKFPNHIISFLETIRDIQKVENLVHFTLLLEFDEPQP